MSTRSLIIEWDGDFAIVSPVPRSHLNSLEIMLGYLHKCWQEDGFRLSDRVLVIAERIAALFPRLDKLEEFGFDVRSLSTAELESLFLGQVVDNVVQPCKLLQMHHFESKALPPKKEGEPLTSADVPIESSGLPDADLFACLIGLDDSIEGAWWMWSHFDAQMISAIIDQLNERRRDPQERLNQYLNERFTEWKQENQQTYLDALGIG